MMHYYYFLLKFHWGHLKQLAISCFLREEGCEVDQHLPDDILVDEVLSRLPAEKVLEFRRVCKNWNSLTSTPSFIRKHEKNASPSILVAYFCISRFCKEQHVFLLDEWGETNTLQNKIKRLGPKKSIYPVPIPNHCDTYMQYNHHGLIIFLPEKDHIRRSKVLYNPVTRQKMVLTPGYGFICGYFYHSLTDEYRIIWCYGQVNSSLIGYQMVNLGLPTWRRLASFDYLPDVINSKDPFLIDNKFIHWITSEVNNTTRQPRCDHSILIFDINKEEFSTMPHPGEKCPMARSRHSHMYLLELKCDLKSLLCLCDCSTQDLIEMWVLEDYDERIWVRRHTIVLNMYRFQVVLKPFGLLNGKMLINVVNLGVFAYDISTGALRRIIEVVDGSLGFNSHKHLMGHVGLFYKSLASFTNFKDLHFNMDPC